MTEALNWLKDVGIATATLFVLGRIMIGLVQSTTEYYRGVREDNKERNRHFELLLEINQTIAHQMALTRRAIEGNVRLHDRQEDAIRAGTAEVTGVRQQVQALSSQQERLIGELARTLDEEYKQLQAEFARAIARLVEHIDHKLEDTQGATARTIVEQLLPVVSRLNEVVAQLVQAQQDVVQSAVQTTQDIDTSTVTNGQG